MSLSKLADIDRRVFYWILFIALMVPFLSPIGFPITIAPNTQDLYDGITGDEVDPGEVWIIQFGYGVSAWSECHPSVTVCTKALFREDAKIIFMGIHYDVELTYNKLLDTCSEDFANKVYGEDYVFLGYFTGGESGVAQMASDIKSVFPQDHFGKPYDDIPMLADVEDVHDIDGVLSSDTGDYGGHFMTQWQGPYGTKLAEIGIAMNASTDLPRWQAGNFFGVTNGSRGGAELEILIGELGEATTAMDSISVSHLLIVIAIILANIGVITEKLGGGKE
ncbi:MAG: hypothetical protein NWF07_16510 [Candidatus Bathyarchaeota archaeon]|nr:hypothetical protein [Candidatus Bathyarchaeota archaeon]